MAPVLCSSLPKVEKKRRWLTGVITSETTRGRRRERDPHTHTEEVAHRCNHQRDHQRKGGGGRRRGRRR
jgi:hypothetical protein